MIRQLNLGNNYSLRYVNLLNDSMQTMCIEQPYQMIKGSPNHKMRVT